MQNILQRWRVRKGGGGGFIGVWCLVGETMGEFDAVIGTYPFFVLIGVKVGGEREMYSLTGFYRASHGPASCFLRFGHKSLSLFL